MREHYSIKLLKEWRNLCRDGFTIPFIIGSQRFLPDTHVVQGIEGLITDLITQDAAEIYLTYCMNIDDLILGIRDKSKSRISGSFPTYKGFTQSKFFQSQFTDDLGTTIEAITASLNEKYHSFINAEQFSKNEGKRGFYSFEEVNFIKKSYNEYFN